jgi:phage terminase large subunit
MLIHNVIFSFKKEIDQPQTDVFFAAAEALSEISGVENFKILKQTSSKNKFEFGISMTFSGHSAYERYTVHPSHQAFVENIWIPNVEDFLEIDLESL